MAVMTRDMIAMTIAATFLAMVVGYYVEQSMTEYNKALVEALK